MMQNDSGVVLDRTRKYEFIVYAVLWLLVLVLPFFNEFMKMADGSAFSLCNIVRWWIGLLPYVVVFCINNLVLVPRFILKNRPYGYFSLLIFLLALFLVIEYFSYEARFQVYTRIRDNLEGLSESINRPAYIFLGLPMPMVMSAALFMMLIAVNTSVSMIFKYIREKETRESLENLRLKDEVRFLKTQINPHFFMNMLNNIHAMIELSPEKAQDMTLELSKLMRHVLYDGESPAVSLASEVSFMTSYVALMNRRYPESKVNISLEVPETPSENIMIPPMLFITFVENAFKHGVSYQKKSIISISLTESDGIVRFACSNTTQGKMSRTDRGGVGLDNVRRRLDLLYSDRYELLIDEGEMFNVVLTIPGI